MDFGLSESQEMLRKIARDFFADKLPKTLVKEVTGTEKGYPADLWKDMAELGWMGLILPEEYGGSEANFADLGILIEEMGRACMPGPFFSTVVLGAPLVLDAGNAAQKKSILPRVARGEIILTVAFAEAQALYDTASYQAEAVKAGDAYVINGTKLFVPDAHVADYIICAAKTGRRATLFLVDARAPGVKSKLLPSLGAERQCEVTFGDVRVSKANILGGLNKAGTYIEKMINQAAAAKCAEMVGGAGQVMEMSVTYAKERVQFGRAIGSQQSIQHHLANMLNDLDECRSVTSRAIWMISEGLPCAREVSVAKCVVNEACRRVAWLGHQIHGAIAFQQDHDMHLYFKQAKVGEVAFGDNGYHGEVIARELGL